MPASEGGQRNVVTRGAAPQDFGEVLELDSRGARRIHQFRDVRKR